jgi:PAS domain S-box-containing protein
LKLQLRLKNKYMGYILFLLFIVLNYLVYYVTEKNVNSKIKYAKYHYMNRLEVNYEVFMETQADKADVIYTTTIENDRLINILSDAWKTKDMVQRDKLREELKLMLQKRYQEFKAQGLLQYHFVFPNNKVFLRVHKMDKYGDDLSDVRLDFAYTNKTYEIVRGFSQGRTAHAFRNVYPIFNHDGELVMSIEISYPSELLQKKLNSISKIHSHFLVNKHIFDSKMWARDDRIINYSKSLEHEDYLLTLSKANKNIIKNLDKLIENLKNEIDIGLSKGVKFSLFSEHENGEFKIVSFYPIKQNVTGEISAWIVSYDDAISIYPAVQNKNYTRISAFIILVFLFYFIYKVNKQGQILSRILSSYDDNVIFSTTDLEGNITQVSKAFCEISGYEESELLGQPHSIVRHPDMPKSAFEGMWKAIQIGKSWKGEVKNLKKDGSFYWVEAEIEPLYDENNKKIGYSAIRHDITDTKEIEKVQKEIIFAMGSIGETRSQETGNHVRRVAEYSKILALASGLSEEKAEMLKQASPMHDIGKVGIPDSILLKPSRLTQEEWETMKTHTDLGFNMLNGSDRPLLKIASIVAYEHHEKWDGSGYPRGLKGEDIHIFGRITAVADVFDALGSDRVYKKAWEDERIFQLFRDESGKHFDPKLVEIFFENMNKLLEIRSRFQDVFQN